MRERMRGNRAGNRREFSLRGWPGRLTGLLACVVVAVAGAGLAVGISSADSGPNAIQNGDFSSSASTGINSGSGITDWPVTVVTQNPTSGCHADGGLGQRV